MIDVGHLNNEFWIGKIADTYPSIIDGILLDRPLLQNLQTGIVNSNIRIENQIEFFRPYQYLLNPYLDPTL